MVSAVFHDPLAASRDEAPPVAKLARAPAPASATQTAPAKQPFDWRGLWLRVLPPVLGLVWRDYFSVDHGLIGCIGSVRSMGQLNAELGDYVVDRRNRGWWRRRARVRVSTQRLRRLARSHLGPRNEERPVEAA